MLLRWSLSPRTINQIMYQRTPSAEADSGWRLSPTRLAIFVTAALWITFACALPLQTAREARRQAHLQLTQVLAENKPDAAHVTAAFDRSVQDVTTASTAPCLGLAICVLLLIHQLLKLRGRYHALERDLRIYEMYPDGPDDALTG